MIDRILLLPYYLTLKIRHFLYDKGYFKSYRFDTPIISIGNITVGGTGKTPHAEAAIALLKDRYRVALISRGYGRKGKGYREVQVDDSFLDVGDEPLQIKRKFPNIRVVVDSSRKRAIDTLLSLPEKEKPTLFVLDDAFQHRAIIPSTSIILVDYSRPIFQDKLIPFGRLRDLPERISAADIVVITKVPLYEERFDDDLWRRKLHLSNTQKIYYTHIEYKDFHPVFSDKGDNRYIYSHKAILFTGIANNKPLIDNLVGKYVIEKTLSFSDHRKFTSSDIAKIASYAEHFSTAILITTEKDAQRLRGNRHIPEELKSRMFYIEIGVSSEFNPFISADV